MQANEIWKSKELKEAFIQVLWKNDDGTIALTFDIDRLVPRTIHNFNEEYLNNYYKPTGIIKTWTIDKNLKQFN